MSNLYVTEYAGAGFVSGHAYNPLVPQEPEIKTTVVSISGSASTMALSSATKLVRLMLDGAALGSTACSVLFGSSGSTTVATTTGQRIVSDVEAIRGVLPYARMTAIANS